jgi:hypothetical protein
MKSAGTDDNHPAQPRREGRINYHPTKKFKKYNSSSFKTKYKKRHRNRIFSDAQFILFKSNLPLVFTFALQFCADINIFGLI